MSEIEELIEKFCPDGVEFKPLYSLTAWDKKFNGTSKITQPYVKTFKHVSAKELKAFTIDNGNIKLLSTGNYDAYTNVEIAGNYINNAEVIAIPSGGSPNIKYYFGTFVDSGNILAVSNNQREYNLKYIYFYLENNLDFIETCFRGSGIQHPNMSKLLNFKIPVPPIEIQCKIVKILDNFTELTAELTAELTTRKQQYEFYREKLLNFDISNEYKQSVEWKTLEKIADIGTGSSNTDDAVKNGLYPFYVRSQNPLRKNDYEYDEIAIITAGDGAGVGKVFHLVNGKYALHQRAYRIHINVDYVLYKYYYYYMCYAFPKYINMSMFQGSVPSIRRPMLNDFLVPIPPIEKQKEIVEQLDKFSKLCEDISEGLPAEIEARKQQYEYYRDRLLTFKEKVS